MEGKKVVWELIRNGKEIVATLEQDADDLEVNGRGYPLSWIVPEEHAEAAFWCGEWDEEGYNYHLDNGDTYLVRYYLVPDNRETKERRDMTGRKTVTTTHGRYTVDGSTSEKTIKLMAMPYEQTLTIHDAATGRLIGGEEVVETPQRGDTILITDYERILPRGEGHIAVVRLAELRGTTTVDECLYETSVVIGDRPFLRMVAESAVYYARQRGIRRVVVANGDVWEVVEAGGIDTTGVEVVRDLSPPAAGDNILVTDFDRHYTMGDEFVAAVRVRERYGYTPTDGGYSETVVVQGDRAKLREAVRRALDYARDRDLRVCVNNRQVREDIEAGVLDTTGLGVVYGGGALR